MIQSIHKKELSNSITLITENISSIKTAAVGFWFPVGSVLECKERTFVSNSRGASHFVEHMLFKGTASKSAYDIAKEFDKVGGYVNAFTERDVTCLYAVVPSIHLLSVLNILCEMVNESVFDKEELEKERRVIKSEIITSQDDPEEAAFDALYQTLWPSQTLSQTIAGSVKDVNKLTQKDIYGWYDKYYKNGKMIVTVAGNIDEEEIEDVIKNLPNRNYCLEDYHKPEFKWQNGSFFVSAPFLQNQVFLSYPLSASFTEKSNLEWVLLNSLIGDTMSSRLFQRLREKKAYCYSVYSFFTVYEKASFWCAYVSVEKVKTGKVIAELEDELKSILSDGITEKELYEAKRHIIGEEIISSEDIEARMKRLARMFFSNFPIITYEEYFQELEKITLEDIQRSAEKVLINENKSILVYGRKYGKK